MLHLKYQKILIFLPLILMLCGFSTIPHGNGHSLENKITSTFSALQTQYFQELNLNASPQMIHTIPTFSAKLNKLADLERAELVAHPNLSQTDKELAGLIFVYDAMFDVGYLWKIWHITLEKVIFSLILKNVIAFLNQA